MEHEELLVILHDCAELAVVNGHLVVYVFEMNLTTKVVDAVNYPTTNATCHGERGSVPSWNIAQRLGSPYFKPIRKVETVQCRVAHTTLNHCRRTSCAGEMLTDSKACYVL